MRVNIYNEEILGEFETLTKTAADTGRTFHGLRIVLKTHEDMRPPHHPDDDSSAVTFWFDSAGAMHLFVYHLHQYFASGMGKPIGYPSCE